jgi:hypothetical protein
MKHFVLPLILSLSSFVLAEEAQPLVVSGVKFTPPAGWKAVEPSSSMRKAQFEITVADQTATLTCAVFQFGGDVESNLQRWKGQLSADAKIDTEQADCAGAKATLFKGVGTYTDPFGGLGAQENYALIGALITHDDGPIVIKIAGPKEAALAVYDAVKKMITTAAK